MFLLKLLVYIVVPAIIIYIFWITYKYFNRTKPQDGSKEGSDIFDDTLV